ncbi:MAG TPA: hypothetical protein PK069_09930 [Methanolinea sp.]|nr:hypothetical protein [Methanolinea sp.]HQK56830.1 hypothetical protein [Methanolinea sp.]
MRTRSVHAFLVISIALNIVLGAALVSILMAPGILPLGTRSGDTLSCDECLEILSDIQSRKNETGSILPASGDDGRRSAFIQGPALLLITDYIQRGPLVFIRSNQTGTMLNISVDVIPGEGRVLVQTTPLMGIVFQEAANTAVVVAAERTGTDLADKDVIFSIESGGMIPTVDGASAGALMAILVESAMSGRKILQGTTITGTISADGRIGAIGGVIEKAYAAKEAGKTLLLLPEENAAFTRVPEGSRNLPGITVRDPAPSTIDAKTLIEQAIGIRVEYVNTIGEVEDLMLA